MYEANVHRIKQRKNPQIYQSSEIAIFFVLFLSYRCTYDLQKTTNKQTNKNINYKKLGLGK